MKYFLRQKNNGYTLLETLIAVSLFLVIVTIGTGSLLNANFLNNKSQNMRSIMDNLNFIMEDMSRNLRVGYNYHCGDAVAVDLPQSCPPGADAYIFFEEVNGDPNSNADQWGYRIFSYNGGTTYVVEKTINSGTTWVPLNSDEIRINSYSGFSVLGAEAPVNPPLNDTQQPFVIIKLSGNIVFKNTNTPFSLQTSVSQRLIDIVK